MAKAKSKIGEEKCNNFGSKMRIINYRKTTDIDVLFVEYNWMATGVQYSHFKKGDIKCPYEPRVYNKGYVGEGEYKVWENNKPTSAYRKWHNMLERCYDEKKQIKCPKYKDCTTCDEWLNFQEYAKWHEKYYYELDNEEVHLDKDILIPGNKIYSPSTCCFVPKTINSIFNTRDKRDNLPTGVYSHGKKYKSRCAIRGKIIHIGIYDTVSEAFLAYKIVKESYIKQIADEYKDVIDSKVYKAMYDYEVSMLTKEELM